jgi:hypothetical protein
MSNLTDLVPPLELCKLIPQGEFQDSALVWIDHRDVYPEENANPAVVVRKIAWAATSKKGVCPAPTLEELIITLADMTTYAVKICKSFNEWHVECCIAVEYGERYLSADSVNNPATAALKLWLKLKGIEDGKQKLRGV